MTQITTTITTWSMLIFQNIQMTLFYMYSYIDRLYYSDGCGVTNLRLH